MKREIAKYKIGIVITCFNRPEYLMECLQSLTKANWNDGLEFLIVLVDDASTNEKTIKMFREFYIPGIPVVKFVNDKNRSVKYSLRIGFDYCFSKHCNYVTNLDSDAVVNKGWINELMYLATQIDSGIVTGFNSASKNSNGKIRHETIAQNEKYCIKKSCGGINMLFNKTTYEQVILEALNSNQPHWDWAACVIAATKKIKIYCTTPSVIQHIGMNSAIGNHDNPDTAIDFKDDRYEAGLNYVINQFRGLGDILFLMPLINYWISQGKKIIWPVVPEYLSIQKHFPEVEFVPMNSLNIDYDSKEIFRTPHGLVIPFRWADQILKRPYKDCMRAKYDMFNINYNMWRELKWVRDQDKEDELFYNVLGLADNEKYNLINDTFRTDQTGRVRFQLNGSDSNLIMRTIPGFTLLDWSKVIEKADKIHTVGTSINYMLEVLELKAKEIHLYVRRPEEKDFSYYSYLLRKDYIFHND